MKRLLPFLIFLAACMGQEEPHEDNGQVTTITDSLTQDSLASIEFEPVEPLASINDSLKQLLDHPIDLIAYKKDWGSSNSGGAGNLKECFRPDTVGQFYNYMFFWKLQSEIPSHPSESELLDKFVITVYKYGNRIGDFFDTNEELIMIKCALDNPTLRKLNWYGKSKIELMDVYGTPQHEADNCLIYTYERKAITAHLSGGKVDWYKYVKLKHEIDPEKKIPDVLVTF